MAPLTPRLLMLRGRPKCDRLSKIRMLDLSGLELKSEHLDPKLLSRLTRLRELDLSNNQLEALPDLGLTQLQVLRCANNHLGDVSSLGQFPQLQELSLEGNPFLTVSDNLKVSFLLPSLQKINGKDTAAASKQVQSLNSELTSRVAAHWERLMGRQSPAEASEQARADFVSSAVRDVHYGPESLRDFTRWRVQKIAEELTASGGPGLQTAGSGSLKASVAQEPETHSEASKRSEGPDADPLVLSPSKRACTSPLLRSGDQPALRLEPLHFLQCHSKSNSPEDLSTQLWACAFEPPVEEGTKQASSQTVATCGGETVCVIDCQTGIVLHKLTAHGEEFFSVAWTVLTVPTRTGLKRRLSVLAAAGLRGLVRLLHVRAGFCCGLIRAHKRAVATLCFSPTHETHLFTASYDKRVILWDIGAPDQDFEFRASALLTLDVASTPLRLCPVASCPDAYLLAGCEGGCCCWDVRLDQPPKRRACEVEFVFPEGEGEDAAPQRVDGLAFVNEDVVASKGGSLGTICLWSWSQTWAARGSQTAVRVVVLARLRWSSTTLAYFSLSACPDEGLVLCGDEEGRVWIYDVGRLLAQPRPRPATPQAPTQVLEWPEPHALGKPMGKTMVNTVVADPSMSYLTALTDSNVVCIWRRL